MSTVLLQVPIDDGSAEFIEVEVDRRGSGESVELVSSQDGPARAAFSFASAISRITPALRAIVDKLRSGYQVPDECSVEMSLKIGGETGLIFARGSTEATFVITATWRRSPYPDSGTKGSSQ